MINEAGPAAWLWVPRGLATQGQQLAAKPGPVGPNRLPLPPLFLSPLVTASPFPPRPEVSSRTLLKLFPPPGSIPQTMQTLPGLLSQEVLPL